MIKPRIFYVGGVMSLLFLLIITLALPGPIRGQHTEQALVVRAGFYQNPPKLYTDAGGAITGFWPDLLSAIAADEGWTIEWVPGTWDESLARLENGQIDVMPDVAWSEPRSQKYAFSTQKVLVSWSRLYARPGSNIETVLDLEGKTVAGLAGSVNYDGAEGIKDITGRFDVRTTFVDLDNYTEVFEALQNNTVDAGVTNKDFGNQYEREYTVERTPFIFQPAHIEFAFPQNGDLTPLLREHIDAHVGALKADPHSLYYQLLEKYLEQQPAATVVEIVPGWVRNVGLAGGAALLFLLAVGVVSRVQVRRRTADLQASEARNRALLSSIPDMMFRLDAQGTFLDYQSASEEMLYASPEQFLGKNVTDVMPPENAAATLRLTRAALDNRRVQTYEYQLPIKEQLHDFEARYIPHRNQDVLVIVRDISGRKQAEEKLKESEEKFRIAFQKHPDAINITTIADGTIIDMNPSFAAITGYSLEEAQGKKTAELELWANPNDRIEMVNRLKKHGYVSDFEFLRKMKDGSIKESAMYVAPITLGNTPCLLTIVRDISEQKKAERALRESETKFRSVIEQATDGISLSDEQGIITEWNRSMAELTGRPAETVLGRYIWDLEAQLDPTRTQEAGGVTALKQSLQNVLQTGHMPWAGKLMEREYDHPDGSQRYIQGSVSAIQTAKGFMLVSLSRDVTERKQAEEALRQSEERYRTLFEEAGDGIMVLDEQSNPLDANKRICDMLGYTRDELMSTNVVALIHPDDLQNKDHAAAMEALLQGQSVHSDYRLKRKDGVYVPTELNTKMLGPGRFLNIGRDITERMQAQEALQRYNDQIQRHAEELEQRVAERTAELDARNRELETFTYSVSHDLKAPLRGIDGYSHLLLEEHAANLNDEGQAFLRTIRQAAAQMGELIDDLLAYSRLERRPHQSEAVDVPVLLESLLAERTADIQAGNVTVNVDVSACAPITADPDGLMLALRNLLDNALKFTQKAAQPIIEVGGRKSQNGCIIWIRDSGIGFDMKFHDRIFDIFQRLHRLEEYPGTGIGLAIVSKAIERMGGRVWAQSEPGRGATFYLEIPAERK